jgi:hypothetical protein
MVANGHLAADDRQLDAVGAVAPFGCVLDEIPDRPFQLFRVAPDGCLIGVEHELEAREAILGSLEGTFGELVEADVLEMKVSLAPARELDDVGDECCELLELSGDVVGVDLLPDGDGGWVVLELNGAVQFTREYRLGGQDVFERVVQALARSVGRETESSGALVSCVVGGRPS